MIQAAPVLAQPSIELGVSRGRPPPTGLHQRALPARQRCDLQMIATMARACLGAPGTPPPLGMQVKEADDLVEKLHQTHSELDFHSVSRASWRSLYNSKALKPVGSCEGAGPRSLHICSFQTYKSSPGLQPPQAKPWKRGAESMRFLPTRRP